MATSTVLKDKQECIKVVSLPAICATLVRFPSLILLMLIHGNVLVWPFSDNVSLAARLIRPHILLLQAICVPPSSRLVESYNHAIHVYASTYTARDDVALRNPNVVLLWARDGIKLQDFLSVNQRNIISIQMENIQQSFLNELPLSHR